MSRVTAIADQRYNVKKVPLYPSNPLDYVIIDSLRLFLRISDNLINLDAEKDKYLDKFSVNNWEKMAFMGKNEHSFANCKGCYHRYAEIQALLPVRSN